MENKYVQILVGRKQYRGLLRYSSVGEEKLVKRIEFLRGRMYKGWMSDGVVAVI